MSRIPDLVEADLTPEQRQVYDAIVRGPRGRVRGPLRIWLTSPELADKAQQLGAYCRYDSSLPPRLTELAILIVGAFWKAGYEWNAHVPQALAAGLSRDVIEAIRIGQAPNLERADERAVHAFARELLTTRRVSAATYRAAEAELGAPGLVDLVGVLGYYGLISMTIVAFEVSAGGDNPFA